MTGRAGPECDTQEYGVKRCTTGKVEGVLGTPEGVSDMNNVDSCVESVRHDTPFMVSLVGFQERHT